MSNISKQAANMIDMLPERDQLLAFEFIRKLVLAWDPDYTKLTPEEAKRLEEAMNEIEVISLEDLAKELDIDLK